jgi:hypothetical protein
MADAARARPLAFVRTTRQRSFMKSWLLVPALLALLTTGSMGGEVAVPGDLHTLARNATGLTEFGIITNKGYVSFAVGADWTVLDSKTKPPVTTMMFHIPNSANKGTTDSANCTVMSFERGAAEAKEGLERAMKKATENSKKSKYGNWSTFNSSELLAKTPYQIRAAVREFQGATVLVYAAWPQLAKNPAAYDEVMDAVFRAVLDSVKCGLGPKPVREGEVFHRPIEDEKNST